MPPSVLMIGNYLAGPAGAPTVGHELARRLQAIGWNVLTTSSRPGRAARLVDMVGTVYRRRRDFDVAQVDVFSGPAFIWAELVTAALSQLRKPWILTLHGGRLPEFARQFPRRVAKVLHAAWAVTTPSEYLRSELADFRDDLRVLPNAIDLSAYHFRPRDHPAPELIWLRAFHNIYEPQLAPAVLNRLSKDFPAMRLKMVGPDERDGSRERTLREAALLGVLPRLELAGGVAKSAVPAWLDGADVFLNTTRVDNTPVSVLEAMASGLCVVSTDPGGIPYLLTHERDAMLSPCGDVEALAVNVRRVLTEPALAGQLSRHGRANAERFDWSAILPQWQELLVGAYNGRA